MNHTFITVEFHELAERVSLFVTEHQDDVSGVIRFRLIEQWKQLRDHADLMESRHSQGDYLRAMDDYQQTEQQLRELEKQLARRQLLDSFNSAALP